MAGAGFTPAAIDDMPMGDVAALLALWHDTPPAQEALAAIFALKPAPPVDEADPSNIGALIARHPGGTVSRP